MLLIGAVLLMTLVEGGGSGEQPGGGLSLLLVGAYWSGFAVDPEKLNSGDQEKGNTAYWRPPPPTPAPTMRTGSSVLRQPTPPKCTPLSPPP